MPWRGYTVVPLATALTIALIDAEVPRRTAFAIARPVLDRLAAQQRVSPDGSSRSTDIAPYGRCTISRDGMVVRVSVDGTHVRDVNGFAYCPSGPPAGPGAYVHFDGPWYRYFRSM